MKTTHIILLAALFVSATIQAGIDDESARDLYFNPSKALLGGGSSGVVISSNEKIDTNFTREDNSNLGSYSGGYYEQLDNPGVTYSIELLRRGSSTTKKVSGNHVFKQGDRIRIHVSANGDGYLHALHKGTTGNSLMIPISTGGRVVNGQDITIPSDRGWLRFDSNKGIEKLNLVFSSHTSASQHGIIPNQNNSASLLANIQQIAAKYSNSKSLVTYDTGGSKDLLVENAGSFPTPGVINRTGRPVAQIAPAIYNAPATYIVNTASEPVAVGINLRHQ